MLGRLSRAVDRFFRVGPRGSSLRGEVLGGVVLFVGNVANVVPTASVLCAGGLPFQDGIVGCAWAGFVSQVCVGVFSNLPIAVSAGAGPNLTVAYLLARPVSAGGVGSYQGALTVCMASGLLIVLLTLSGAISAVTNLVPVSLKHSICVGIGLLCAFVGFQQAGMVVRSEEGLVGPGDFAHSPQIWLTLAGLILLTLLSTWKVKGGVLLSMLALTVLDWTFVSHWPPLELSPVRLPDFTLPATAPLRDPGFWGQAVAMTMMLVFDAMGCIFGLSRMAGCTDPETGEVVGGAGMFGAIGITTSLAGACGVSPIVVYGGSAAAIADGARTGLSTCVSGLLMLLAIPLADQLASMPPCASAFMLIYVGVSMSADASHIAWDDPVAAVPAFLCIVSQPFLFSIADGIYMGLGAWLALQLCARGAAFCPARCCRPGAPAPEGLAAAAPGNAQGALLEVRRLPSGGGGPPPRAVSEPPGGMLEAVARGRGRAWGRGGILPSPGFDRTGPAYFFGSPRAGAAGGGASRVPSLGSLAA